MMNRHDRAERPLATQRSPFFYKTACGHAPKGPTNGTPRPYRVPFGLRIAIGAFFLWCMIMGGAPGAALAGEVTVHWTPCDTAGHYRLSWRKASGEPGVYSGHALLNHPGSPPPVMSHTVEGLEEETTYYFAVRAYNEANEAAAYSQEISVAFGSINTVPTVITSPPQIAVQGQTIILSGDGSSDPDGSIVNWHWRQVFGFEDPEVTLTGADTQTATFIMPEKPEKPVDPENPDAPETPVILTFQLTVTDNDGATDSAITEVQFALDNRPPSAHAGPDQFVLEEQTVTLTAQASIDPDDGIASYQWTQTQGTPVTLSNASSIKPTFTAPAIGEDDSAQLVFEVLVTDTEGLADRDTVTITITKPLHADAGGDQIVREGEEVTLNGSASRFPEGCPPTWHWSQTGGPDVSLDTPDQAMAHFIAPRSLPQDIELTFTLTVSDTDENTSEATCTVRDTLTPIEPQTTPAHASVEIIDCDMEHRLWLTVGWENYRKATKEARVASGDLNGDGNTELIIGLGPVEDDAAIPGGFFQVVSPTYQHLAWGRLPEGEYTRYNECNGETWPACGDLNNDGRDEIVVGLGKGGEGRLAIFSFDGEHVTFQTTMTIPWEEYNIAVGETRPACGDIDDDGCMEIIVGLGGSDQSPVSPDGRYAVLDRISCADMTVPFDSVTWGRLTWEEYNTQNGETWPTCGKVVEDESDKDEIIVGLGKGGAGRTAVVQWKDDTLTHLKWLNVAWEEYNALTGETRPTCVDMDNDGTHELIVGLGPVEGDATLPAGRLPAITADGELLQWGKMGSEPYNRANGESRPAAFVSEGEPLIAVGMGPYTYNDDDPDPNDPSDPRDPTGPQDTPAAGGGSSGGCFIQVCREECP
ncbi:PKD domain-containing protein [Desulfoluna spongiiphila]|uniref:PKD domain-containing protein n=1 Tax=Desulfoluna spongiiphila TaxID=419481 RepID=UPI00125F4153|nr:FG-GAP-like repeat-containing protein [Desulfoluna spongiiphila]